MYIIPFIYALHRSVEIWCLSVGEDLSYGRVLPLSELWVISEVKDWFSAKLIIKDKIQFVLSKLIIIIIPLLNNINRKNVWESEMHFRVL